MRNYTKIVSWSLKSDVEKTIQKGTLEKFLTEIVDFKGYSYHVSKWEETCDSTCDKPRECLNKGNCLNAYDTYVVWRQNDNCKQKRAKSIGRSYEKEEEAKQGMLNAMYEKYIDEDDNYLLTGLKES